jgi:uncharacterized membrane protein (UPF0127 family)
VPRGLILLAACVAIASCDGRAEQTDYGGVMHFDTTQIRILTGRDSIPLWVEIASSAEQRTMGLMERRVLPDSKGMLFLYPSDQPATAGFWMFRTRIPLDIAFLDSAGAVVAIRNMAPCSAELAAGCPTYSPGVPYRAALEVNAGYFQRHGVAIGSRVTLPSVRAQ